MQQLIRIILSLIVLSLCLAACESKESAGPTPSPSPTVAPTASASPASTAETSNAGLKTTPSGLKYQDLVTGTGQRPFPGQKIRLRYTGWTEDGIKFDSNQDGAKPALEIQLGKGEVIKGWEIGVGGGRGIEPMRVGGKRKLVIPPDLGYGSTPMGTIPPNSTLMFEIELISAK